MKIRKKINLNNNNILVLRLQAQNYFFNNLE